MSTMPCTQPEEPIANTGIAPRGTSVVAGSGGYPGRPFVRRLNEIDTLPGVFDGVDIAFSSVGIRHFWRRLSNIGVDFGADRRCRHLAELAAASAEK